MASRNQPKFIVDADGHVVEPVKMCPEHLESKYRRLAPDLGRDKEGNEWLMVGGKPLGVRPPFSVGAAMIPGGLADPVLRHTTSYADASPGGYDPHARIRDLDTDGIEVVVLFPGVGLFFGGIEDEGLAAALCRAYNDWLAEDYCKPYSSRLIGVAVMPMQDIDAAIAEAQRAVGKLGMRGVMIRPNPYKGRNLDDPAYDRFWACIQDLDVPVCVHEATTRNMPTAGIERCTNFFFAHMISHPHEQQIALMQLIAGGVLERFPRLKVGFYESGGGWLPAWLDRLDSHYEKLGFIVPHLRMKPSEYFKRQCHISVDPDERTLPFTVDLVGEDRVVWASDFPHFDAVFPGAVAEVREQPLSEDAMRKVLGDNAVRIHKL